MGLSPASAKPQAPPEQRFLTVEEVARRYRTTANTVRYWRQIGYGPKGFKVGRRVLYRETEVIRFESALVEGYSEQDAS